MSRELLEAVVAKNESKVTELLKNPNININEEFVSQNKMIGTATVLHIAAIKGYDNLLRLLLDHPSIKPNIPTGIGLTALQSAVDHSNLEACKLLLPVTDVTLTEKKTQGAYSLAKLRVKTAKTQEEKQRAEAIVELLRIPTFVTACARGNFPLVKKMAEEENVDINAFYGDGFGLYYASINGHKEVVDYLLTRPGVNINQRTPTGLTILNEISRPYNFKEIKSQAHLYEKFIHIPHPLVKSTYEVFGIPTPREYIAKKLIAHGADVYLTGSKGTMFDPLMMATLSNALDIVKILVEDGKVDPERRYVVDRAGTEPETHNIIDLAAHYRPEISSYLQEAKNRKGGQAVKKAATDFYSHRPNQNPSSVQRQEEPPQTLKVC